LLWPEGPTTLAPAVRAAYSDLIGRCAAAAVRGGMMGPAWRGAWLSLAAAALCAAAHAQVPETGRWQDLDFNVAEVHLRSAFQYQALLVEVAADGRLDDDPAILRRVEAVAATLIHVATDFKPESARWQWEIHTTSDPSVDAVCMAGGRMLVGSDFVRRLKLDDGELAVLIGHEMAHALAEHHHEMLSGVRRLTALPRTSLEITMLQLESDWLMQLRLSKLSSIQESEADQLGMTLVHRAGWPSAAMIRFYEKLVAVEEPSALSATHPGAVSRLSMARGMVRLFDD
jgi:predicted Zn-dependent protease